MHRYLNGYLQTDETDEPDDRFSLSIMASNNL